MSKREAFEKWVTQVRVVADLTRHDTGYRDQDIDWLWAAFGAGADTMLERSRARAKEAASATEEAQELMAAISWGKEVMYKATRNLYRGPPRNSDFDSEAYWSRHADAWIKQPIGSGPSSLTPSAKCGPMGHGLAGKCAVCGNVWTDTLGLT